MRAQADDSVDRVRSLRHYFVGDENAAVPYRRYAGPVAQGPMTWADDDYYNESLEYHLEDVNRGPFHWHKGPVPGPHLEY